VITLIAWAVTTAALITVTHTVWVEHLARPKISAFFWFAPSRQPRVTAVATFATAFAIWHLLSIMLANPLLLPTPAATIQALASFPRMELAHNALHSILRVAVAFSLASAVGLTMGLAAGLFPWIHRAILPLNSALRYIPPTAFIGLTIVWFGVDEGSKIALIIIGVLFYIIQMTVDVARTFPRPLAEAAPNLGATDWETFRYIIWPYCVPAVLSVLRVNLGAAWTFVVAAEVVSAQTGLGHMMAISQRFLLTPQLFALLVLTGIIGFLSDALFGIAIRRTSTWA